MRYFAVTRVRGPAWDPSRPMRAQDGWAEHAAFMDGLAAEGVIVLGGPLDDGEREFLLVFEAEDEAAVAARLAEDPWTPNGRLRVARIAPWQILLER